MMTGYFKVPRSVWDNPFFRKSEVSEREAWMWLMSQAAYMDRRVRANDQVVELQRGQLCHSLRFMARAWGWTKDRVDRFIRRLEKHGMVCRDPRAIRDSTATGGKTQSATAQTILTICNYDKIQGSYSDRTTGAETGTSGKPRQHRDSTATKKKKGIRKDNKTHVQTLPFGTVRTDVQENAQDSDHPVIKAPPQGKPTRANAVFDEFWTIYPRRQSKKGAKTKFEAAVKSGVDPRMILDGARRYARYVASNVTDPKFIKQPTTWLNNGCWDDELPDNVTRLDGHRKSNLESRAMNEFCEMRTSELIREGMSEFEAKKRAFQEAKARRDAGAFKTAIEN